MREAMLPEPAPLTRKTAPHLPNRRPFAPRARKCARIKIAIPLEGGGVKIVTSTKRRKIPLRTWTWCACCSYSAFVPRDHPDPASYRCWACRSLKCPAGKCVIQSEVEAAAKAAQAVRPRRRPGRPRTLSAQERVDTRSMRQRFNDSPLGIALRKRG